MRKSYFLLTLLIVVVTTNYGQVYLKANEHRQRLTNGLSLFYTQIDGSSNYEMMLCFRFGAIVEDTATDGLGYVCHTVFLNGLQQHLQKVDKSIKVDGRFGFEASTYQFIVSAGKFQDALDAIAYHYANGPDSAIVASAITQNATLFSILQNTLLYPAEQDLIARQWGLRAPSLSLYGPIPSVDSTTVSSVLEMYRDGYCIEFAQLAFNGPKPFREVWSVTQNQLSYISSCPGELFNTKLANLYPSPVVSSQLVYGVGNATPTRYQKSFQGPYLSFDVQGCLSALVLKQLLNQPTGLNLLYDSLKVNKLLLAFDPQYYASALTWHIFPRTDSLHVAYRNFDTIMRLIADGNVFEPDDIEEARNVLIKQYETLLNNPSLKLYLASQYWSNNTFNWLVEYTEALKAITHEHVSKMVKDYVLNRKYTALLLLNDADSSAYNYRQFVTTYTAVDSLCFHYQRNNAMFASGQDDSTFAAFEQTLLINPDLMVVLNATAYKSELLKVNDDSLAAVLSNYKGYYIYPMTIGEGKNTFRLDIYRAATLIAKLLQSGVLPNQLKGTGTLKKGDDGKEEYLLTVSPVFNKKKL